MKKKQWLIWIIVCVPLCLFLLPRTLPAAEEAGWTGLEVLQLYDYATKDSDKRGSLVVLNVLPGSPADQQGVRKGDIILEIDNIPTRRHAFNDIMKNLWGSASKTDIKLILWRPCYRQQIEVKIKRIQAAN